MSEIGNILAYDTGRTYCKYRPPYVPLTYKHLQTVEFVFNQRIAEALYIKFIRYGTVIVRTNKRRTFRSFLFFASWFKAAPSVRLDYM